MSPADIEDRVREVEMKSADHDTQLAVQKVEMGTMKEVVTDLTEHLGTLNASVERLTKYIIVIFIIAMVTDNHDPLVKWLGLS